MGPNEGLDFDLPCFSRLDPPPGISGGTLPDPGAADLEDKSLINIAPWSESFQNQTILRDPVDQPEFTHAVSSVSRQVFFKRLSGFGFFQNIIDSLSHLEFQIRRKMTDLLTQSGGNLPRSSHFLPQKSSSNSSFVV